MNAFIWFTIIILLIITEKLTKKLTTIWYAISASISFVLALIGHKANNFTIEFMVFIIIGTVLLIFVKQKIVENKKQKIQNVEKEIVEKKKTNKKKKSNKKKKRNRGK